MAEKLNLNQINYQDNLRSKPVRENYTDIETTVNNLITEFDAAVGSISTGAEVINARDGFPLLQDRIQHNSNQIGDAVLSGLNIQAQGTPDNTVLLNTGSALINGVGIDITSTVSSGTIAAVASGKHRYDMVTINTSEQTTITKGIEVSTGSGAPFKEPNASQLLLAHLYIDESATVVINSDDILDSRKYTRKITDSNQDEIRIANQNDFQYYFGHGNQNTGSTDAGWSISNTNGTTPLVSIPANTKIRLFRCNGGGTTGSYNGQEAYILRTKPQVNGTIQIVGDDINNCIIVKDTLLDWSEDIKFYTATASNILFDGFTFDGRGGLGGFGGSLTTSGNGGAFNLSNCTDSIFDCKVINHNVNGNGGAIYGNDNSNNIQANNIYNCQAVYGGGVSNVMAFGGYIDGCSANTGNATFECTGSRDIKIKNMSSTYSDNFDDSNSQINSCMFKNSDRYFRDSNVSASDIFTILNPYIPNVNNNIPISGHIYNVAGAPSQQYALEHYSYATRTGENTMALYGVNFVGEQGATATPTFGTKDFLITKSGAPNIDAVAISW
jgi:hypothetical protein